MHIHVLGICGTFMGSLAQLAKAQGHRVTGSDANVYPPMSTQLEAAGIDIYEGYDAEQFSDEPDLVIIGNAMSRGNTAVEAVLAKGIAYTSGPQWLCDHVLQGKWVLAIAGTHGKTTTSSMLTWILTHAGMKPGYLIGGVPKNLPASASLGDSVFFVVEADEYDSAFFDKRSKFVHYRPRTVVINNLEFDHADIFPDLEAIQTQFHHLLRTVPENGYVIYPQEPAIHSVIERGCWSEQVVLGEEWSAAYCSETNSSSNDGSQFEVFFQGQSQGVVRWSMTGDHNRQNALAAIAAARTVGVRPEDACQALCEFEGVKRRMEKRACINGVTVYDDFAHHPTAIEMTLAGLRAHVGTEKILVVIEPRSNTMRMGVHKAVLPKVCMQADMAFWYQPPGVDWDMHSVVHHSAVPAKLYSDLNTLQEDIVRLATPDTHIVIMSNGGFGGLHEQLIERLRIQMGQ
ncbi:UDP-N-acetylmuramate:L-alanyl-gamma-D-glutamyl-meso-diaminopimelate ligase [Marinibactrum halimedae]|nr:UDP-N-acetylmuramate:L-alanyl-gamma-D-glutamyl-meso-diaminopimelate ligase [Marinibactrum halimedae]MCD9458975.1 UDP-N-acetylmuramate:L-alanyl-gamma-D-glutamyl-meso-diaminopimelate ligase [Marinibactrum halimedae]